MTEQSQQVDMGAGPVHFIGVGGSGMSGIARILLAEGVQVTGSDAKDSRRLTALRALGADIAIGHDAANVRDDTTVVVRSTAIARDNPEVVRATELGIPILHRSEALAKVMEGSRVVAVTGTHGKTTTTSMLTVALQTVAPNPASRSVANSTKPGHTPTGAPATCSSQKRTKVTARSSVSVPPPASSPTSSPITSTTGTTSRL